MEKIIAKVKAWEENSSKREKLFLIIGTILIPLFLYFKFYYFPSQEKINNLEKDIEQINLEIAQLEKLVKNEVILENRLKGREAFLEEIKLFLPTEREFPELLKKVSLLAKKNKLEILKFQLSGEEKKDYYDTILFEVTFKGLFIDSLKFLNEVVSLERIVNIHSLEFLPQEKEERLLIKSIFKTYKYTGVPVNKK